mmetsp:Transcript_15121/g.35629  ORF Transcript_15121/g.35629 Transcript_15121/m.35629 type:complete len:127 (-) Transcript_15121:179-559(-)
MIAIRDRGVSHMQCKSHADNFIQSAPNENPKTPDPGRKKKLDKNRAQKLRDGKEWTLAYTNESENTTPEEHQARTISGHLCRKPVGKRTSDCRYEEKVQTNQSREKEPRNPFLAVNECCPAKYGGQ